MTADPAVREVWPSYRMNDYVGAGVYATLTWPLPCTDPKGHMYGHLSQTCLRCRCEPTIEYERNVR